MTLIDPELWWDGILCQLYRDFCGDYFIQYNGSVVITKDEMSPQEYEFLVDYAKLETA